MSNSNDYEKGKKPVAYKRCPPCIWSCLLYTSDAADERSSVDLGGRRIIKKKKKKTQEKIVNTKYIVTHIGTADCKKMRR